MPQPDDAPPSTQNAFALQAWLSPATGEVRFYVAGTSPSGFVGLGEVYLLRPSDAPSHLPPLGASHDPEPTVSSPAWAHPGASSQASSAASPPLDPGATSFGGRVPPPKDQ